ncbi:MAG: hypothetical protein ACRCYO_00195 [Bacteroidia bacterium]
MRSDQKILKKHAAFLKQYPELKKLYVQLSTSIQNSSTKN